MKGDLPSLREDDISQIPALILLQQLGYTYLPPIEAETLRGGKLGNVLLSGVLEEQLRKINKIRFKGAEYEFSEGNIQAAIQALTDLPLDGLVRTNEKIYDLLTLGKSLSQTIYGDTKSFPLRYVDWENPENNVYHVSEEFTVERTASHKTRRPDIVLFVNGIPFCVIECKRPDLEDADPIEEAVRQQIKYQREDEIPRLYLYAQLLLAISKNDARYGATGSGTKFWSVWREREDTEAEVEATVRQAPARPLKDRLFASRSPEVRRYFDDLFAKGGREVTHQDRTIYALCRPERLLELTFRYTIFDAGERKVARYQQYFCVRRTMERIRNRSVDGPRRGGVVWHTQGSGKSLTMVMIAQAIALEPDVPDYKIVLVTDRVDLDDQIYKTFQHCGTEPVQAKTGRHLAELISRPKSRIITTVIDKFETAVGKAGARNASPNVFVLVDEGHRGQYGELHAKMKKGLPNACFIAFTGTPVAKREKDTIRQFGGLIDSYTIREAVEDKAVVPLLYEGRDVEQRVDREAIDSWFEKLTSKLSREQKADLKKKFTTTEQLNKTQQRVMRIAWDISVHFRDNWQGKGTKLKAQLVTASKSTALLYKKYLDEFGMVSSEVLISAPDENEGSEDIYGENESSVISFWKKMMEKYGSERAYNTNIINAFKNADDPEIIIVVDKLLTGFDAPRNTILYLTRQLKDHTLLQAIARVNRLHDGKDFGFIIDYRGVLQNLDKALDLYGKLSEFDSHDLTGTLTDISVEIESLRGKHTDLWSMFQGINNRRDEEAFERLLADRPVRERFYDLLSRFARTLAIALSSAKFTQETPEETVTRYKEDLAFFMRLRTAVRRRYADAVDFKEYEPKIQKLLDTHVGTGEVEQVTSIVNIFDEEFDAEVARQRGDASKADTIAYRTKAAISERWDEDPALYRRFSEMIEEAIRAHRDSRLSDAEYLARVTEIKESVRSGREDDLPAQLQGNEVARSYYHELADVLASHPGGYDTKSVAADAGLKIDDIIQSKRIVGWTTNIDVQNRMRLQIEDYLHELAAAKGFALSFDEIDEIMETCLDIARRRCP